IIMNTEDMPVGVVGLGFMGCGITTCLLMSGHPVVALAPIPADLENVESRVKQHLIKSKEEGLIIEGYEHYLSNLTITQDYNELKDCKLVVECVIENFDIKRDVYSKIEACISDDCLLTSNTSAIPISDLQNL